MSRATWVRGLRYGIVALIVGIALLGSARTTLATTPTPVAQSPGQIACTDGCREITTADTGCGHGEVAAVVDGDQVRYYPPTSTNRPSDADYCFGDGSYDWGSGSDGNWSWSWDTDAE